MRQRRRLWRRLGLAALPCLAAVLLATPGGAAPADAAPSAPVLQWHTCHDLEQAGFQCATADVPLDYRRPNGARINLSVIRHPAGSPSQRVGTLFFHPGGPGRSGVRALVDWFERFPPTVRQRFDIIGWDPRGVGASTPVNCFATAGEALTFFANSPAGFPVGPTQARIWTDTYARFGGLCRERNGELLDHLSAADTARDLEVLRRRVGDPWMNYYGTSYGTVVGATYANLFPGRVRAMVLDGNVDPVAWMSGSIAPPYLSTSQRLNTDLASNKVLTAFLDHCGRAGPVHCPFAGVDAAATREKFAALLDRIRRQSIPFNGAPVTYAVLVNALVSRIIVGPAGYGFAGWAAAADLLQTLWVGGSDGVPTPEPYDHREQQFAVRCGESPNPRYPGYYRALTALAFERAGDVGPNWAWSDEPCASWPATAANPYLGPWDHRTANPLLVIGTTFDPSTAYEGSLAMARRLARARLLTVDGYGHTALLNPSNCASGYVSRYLLSGVLPPPGSVCRQDAAPFEAD